MEVYYLKSSDFKPKLFARPMVMALGFFDGVHLGHQQVINTARKFGQEKNLPLAVMTFDRHSSMVFADPKKASFRYLITLQEKIDLMKREKVDYLFVVEFSRDFAATSPEDFVQRYLIDLQVKAAVAGFDFTFGKYGLGDMELLKKLGEANFQTVTVPKKNEHNHKISSTRIRKLISEGKMEDAVSLLGHEYLIEGKLLPDRKIMITNKLQQLPPKGTYLCQTQIGSEQYNVQIDFPKITDQPACQVLQADLQQFSENNLEKYDEVKIIWPLKGNIDEAALNNSVFG